MRKFLLILLSVFLTYPACAKDCVSHGFTIEGTSNRTDIPTGYTRKECKSCRQNNVYYWKCNHQSANKKVNCMDYLRANDADGFAKCTGLPGKWEIQGNQLNRVE